MKSKYAELFTAKLNDMDLVLFEKHRDWGKWALAVDSDRCFMVSNNFEYFLCLPQHKDACLHWLNGGEVQAIHFENQMPDSGVMFDSEFVDLEDEVSTYPWKNNHIFMQEHEIIIKPKKEKRVIGVNKDGRTTSHYAIDDEGCYAVDEIRITGKGNPDEWQFIEIEVEV